MVPVLVVAMIVVFIIINVVVRVVMDRRREAKARKERLEALEVSRNGEVEFSVRPWEIATVRFYG